MVNTTQILEQFPKVLERYSTTVESKKLEKIVSEIDKLRNQNPSVYDEEAVTRYLQERSRTLKGLVEEYFIASTANKFPLISEELFQLKRYLSLRAEGKTWKVVRDDTEAEQNAQEKEKVGRKIIIRRIEVPLFAYTPLFERKHTTKLGGFTKQTGYYTKTTVTIEARLPGSIGPNLKNAYRDALSHYFGVLSKMFTNPVAGDIMYAEGSMAENRERIKSLYEPEIGAIWIPAPESLNVSVDQKLIQKRKVIDPAMILKVRGKNYLVQTWRVDDEQPFEHYLREFSIGDLKGKVR